MSTLSVDWRNARSNFQETGPTMNGKTMLALMCEEYGLPETLHVREIAVPTPGEGEVLIRIYATGLNLADCLIIQNKYQIKPPLPFSPGGEMAGTVEAVGPGVTRFTLGDRVAALTHWGGFAEYVVAREDSIIAVPESMDLETAGAFTLVYGTAHHAFKQRSQLKPGETVLVLGSSGGVGLAAVEVAKAMGAHVIAGASTAEKLAIAREHGADEFVNYTKQDLKSVVKGMTGAKGVDVVFDPVGDALADPAFRTLGWNGRYLVIGFAGGKIPALPFNLPLVKGAAIVGVYWGDFAAREPTLHHENMAELYAMHAAGKLKPLISARYPITESASAIRLMLDRKATGKVIVTGTQS
jgi:NADPH2:quinone reductase